MTLTVCILVVLLIRNVYYLCTYNVNLSLYEAYTVCADSQDLPSVFAIYKYVFLLNASGYYRNGNILSLCSSATIK